MTKFSFAKRGKSFVYAWRGIVSLVSNEHNAWIHCVAAVVTVTAGFAFGISRVEWIAVVICIAAVFAAEAFNTAVERLVDIVSPDYDRRAGAVKDVAAGAVLLTAIGAAVVGLLVFVPHIAALF